MNITVAGLWHLGCVVSAGLAKAGHRVAGYDPDAGVVAGLKGGKAPLFEPDLDDTIAANAAAGRLTFTNDRAAAVADAELLWIAYDTPVSEDDRADTGYVEKEIRELLAVARPGLLVQISSQMPAGTIRAMEREHGDRFHFACSPENLRLGQALAYFLKPDRVVVGVRRAEDRVVLERALSPLACPVEWMSVESAEMAKHAINSFLAMSVTFANELAVLCEKVGADGREVERALKTESRIGPKAYVRPGSAFAGGTLARDVVFLSELARRERASIALIPAIQAGNEEHKKWMYRNVEQVLGGKRGAAIAVLGLTYKPGTDTLRRSTSVEFCRWAAGQGHQVRAHDPKAKVLPDDLAGKINLCPTALDACRNADVMVIGTPWPEYKEIDAADVARIAPGVAVMDPNRFLVDQWPKGLGMTYFMVGAIAS